MSTIEAAASSETERIPLGRRIGEIMDEKGDAFSIRAFAFRISMNREVLRVMIAGERTILPNELEKIANGLGVSVERLKQIDTLQEQHELISLLVSKRNLERALVLAKHLVAISVGLTERCINLNNLGRVLFLLERYDEAHQTWMDAFALAQKINLKYKEQHFIYVLTVNLILSSTQRREFSNMDRMITEVEEFFSNDPEKMGILFEAKMKMAEQIGDLEKAKKYAYLSLESRMKSNNKTVIGRAFINVAHYEYIDGHFERCIELLPEAISRLDEFTSIKLIAVKEYAKSLVRLKDNKAALEIIQSYLPKSTDFPDIEAKFMILESMVTGVVEKVEKITTDLRVSLKVRALSCKHLMEYYEGRRDSDSLLKYYEMRKSLFSSPYVFLDEEEF